MQDKPREAPINRRYLVSLRAYRIVKALLVTFGILGASMASYAAVFVITFSFASTPAALAWQPSLLAAAVGVGGLAWGLRGTDKRRRIIRAVAATVIAGLGLTYSAWLSGLMATATQATQQPASKFEGFVAIRGGSMFYRQSAVTGSELPVVLVIHGGPGSGSISLRAALERPLAPAVRAIFYDQRGVGRSSLVLSFGLDDYLEDVERLRSELGVERWYLVGVSWGSVIAVEYALRHPDRVQGVVTWGGLVASQPSARGQLTALAAHYKSTGDNDAEAWANHLLSQKTSYSRLQMVRIMNAVNRSRLKSVLTSLEERERVQDVRRQAIEQWGYTAEETTRGFWATLATFMQTRLESYDVRPRLPSLSVPLLALGGERDPILVDSGIDRDVRSAPQATFRWMPGLGHAIDDPGTLVREILEFVADHEA